VRPRPEGERHAVWIEAAVTTLGEQERVVARYDGSDREGHLGRTVTGSRCTSPVANECQEPLDLDHPATVPDAIFPGPKR
jgi:hypothetical protein